MDAKKDISRESFFLVCRTITIIIGLYHANKFFFPTDGNALRHLVFVGINAIVVYGLWKRPIWFSYFFCALMLQQFYSHGGSVIVQWQTKHTVDWKSIAVISLMPIIFIALIKENLHASKAPSNS